jgi:tRNA(Ile)-lysidine synthase
MELSRRVVDTIHRYALLRRGARVLVAVSGGSDSVALLLLLRELEHASELTIAGVAHLNHSLRPSSDDDQHFCAALCASLGIPFRAVRFDVRALADEQRISLEDAGRKARYEWFERVAEELGAEAIATGHTRDDQAETFLLRLIRGAGPRGLAGIHPRAGRVVRPVIEIGRDELRAYLAAIGQPFVEDQTNADVSIPRNRIRHELLPILRRDYSPRITGVLAREAAIAREDEDRLQQEAIDLADSIVLATRTADRGEGIETVDVDARTLAGLHPALGRRVTRLALAMLAPDRFVGYDHIDRVLELANSPHRSGALSLPGQHVMRRGDILTLRREPFQPFSNSFRVSLSIPGEVVLEPQGWAVSAIRGHSTVTVTDRFSVALPAASAELPLAVRSREPGDWFRPLGMGGQGKKLQDFLVDRKVPRERRDALPLVVDSADRIVWVVGESVAEDFRVTAPSQGVIFLKARRLGGQG